MESVKKLFEQLPKDTSYRELEQRFRKNSTVQRKLQNQISGVTMKTIRQVVYEHQTVRGETKIEPSDLEMLLIRCERSSSNLYFGTLADRLIHPICTIRYGV